MTKICIDLFSGAGGLSEGLASAGFHSLYASEINPVFATTYRNNHPHSIVDTGDIKEVNSDEVMKRLGIERGELDLMAGGPPCQGFSINAPVRSKKDQRNHLFREFLRFVDTFQPKTILIENVPGLVSFENGATLHAILSSLVNLGYGAEVRILGAPYYGVPQMRWRTIILGVRGMQLPADAYPEPLYRAPIRTNFRVKHEGKLVVKMPSESAVEGFTTVEDAISDLPKICCGEKYEEGGIYASKPKSEYQKRLRIGSAGVFNHESSGLSKVNLERLKFIKPGRNWTDTHLKCSRRG